MARRHCVVLGAGVAGLAAALELARRGCRVTVVEAAPFAGGRTSSWRTASGLHADTGLHVVADHYGNLLEIIRSVGAGDGLRWWDQHHYYRPDGSHLVLRMSRLPAPFHLLHPARKMPVPVAVRRRLLRVFWELARTSQRDLVRWDDLSYLDWHRSYGLGEGYLMEMADYAADAVTFLSPARVSARAVLSWLKYMFRSSQASRIGTWRGPMSEILVRPLIKAIEASGGTVRTSTAVVRCSGSQNGLDSVIVRRSLASGACHRADGSVAVTGPEEQLRCDYVISALPVQALRTILDPELVAPSGLEAALMLQTVPALSVVVKFDRRAPLPHEGAVMACGSSVRNVVDVHALWDEPAEGTTFEILVSHATERSSLDDRELVALVVDDLCRLHPPLRGARLVDSHVERIEAAMFAAFPGTHKLRPATQTRIGNFFLAGDWTRHDLNASMEGAAHSGRVAARLVLERIETGRHFVPEIMK